MERTMNQQSLFDQLQQKGIPVKNVWFENNFVWHPSRGWWAEDQVGNEYFLGKTFLDAKVKIMQDKVELIED